LRTQSRCVRERSQQGESACASMPMPIYHRFQGSLRIVPIGSGNCSRGNSMESICARAGRDWRRTCAMLAGAFLVVGCVSGGTFRRGPRPVALVGTWIDSAATTPNDTTFWVLDASGSRRIVDRRQTDVDQWYVSNNDDPARAKFCFAKRARNGATCARFELRSVSSPSGRPRRRLVVHSYDPHSDRNWVFLEPVR